MVVNMKKSKLDLLVRAIIETSGKIMICRKKGEKYFFLPGGHMEFGESGENALKREIGEELGLRITKCSLIGGSEHLFREDKKEYHEINLVFRAETDRIRTESREDHLEFFLLNKKQLAKNNFMPKVLKVAILKWFRDGKFFWASQI